MSNGKTTLWIRRLLWQVNAGALIALCLAMAVMLLAFSAAPAVMAAEVAAPDLDELRALSRLPKPHYSVPLHEEIRKNRAVMSEFVRITGACSVHPFWTGTEQVQTCIDLCKEHGSELAVYYSPFLRRFNAAKKAAKAAGEPFDSFPLTVEVDGPFLEELHKYGKALGKIAQQAALKEIKIGAVVFDQEQLFADDVTEGVVRWKQEQFYNVAVAKAPGAEIIWFGRGGFREAAKPGGWQIMPNTRMDVPGTCVTVPLYWITETHHWRSAVRLTHAENPDARIIPFVSIGWQWTRDRPGGRKGDHTFPTEASFRIGTEINHRWYGRHPLRFLPNHDIPAVVVYWTGGDKFPPQFWDHFTAYVSGATGKQ